MSKENVLFPAGRMVWGSSQTVQTTDMKGNPLTVKNGPNAGQPTQRVAFGVAIAKGAEQGWWETEWGSKIFATASASFINGETSRPDFSWKITDGDSQALNQNNKRWCDKEGYPGHWVISFSTALSVGNFALSSTPGKTVPLTQEGEIVPGYYVEVYGNFEANGDSQRPGVFINPVMVCRIGYGERILSGPSPEQAGFGAGGLPAGASAAPLGSTPVGAPVAPAPVAPAPVAPAPVAPAPVAPAPVAPAPVAPAPVAPNPGILQVPTQ